MKIVKKHVKLTEGYGGSYSVSAAHHSVPVRVAKKALDLFWRDIKDEPPTLNIEAFHTALDDTIEANGLVDAFDPVGLLTPAALKTGYTDFKPLTNSSDYMTKQLGMALMKLVKHQSKHLYHKVIPLGSPLNLTAQAQEKPVDPEEEKKKKAAELEKSNKYEIELLLAKMHGAIPFSTSVQFEKIFPHDRYLKGSINVQGVLQGNNLTFNLFTGGNLQGIPEGYVIELEFNTEDEIDLKQIMATDTAVAARFGMPLANQTADITADRLTSFLIALIKDEVAPRVLNKLRRDFPEKLNPLY